MTKHDLQNLVSECLQEYFTASTLKEKTTMKKSELKTLVTEVVRQCVKEAGPQYKVRGKKSQLEQPGLRNKAREMQDDPEINEVAPPGLESPMDDIGEEPNAPEGQAYDETEEVELLKQLGQIVLKLLQMHRGEDTTGGESDEDMPFKGVPEKDEAEPETSSEEEEEAEEFPLKESNHKVQHRSHKTIKDVDQDPTNVRDPEVPQA